MKGQAIVTASFLLAVLLGDSITEITCWRTLQAYDITRNNIAGQFILSTNKVNIGKRDVNNILSSYTTIINTIRNTNPEAKIFRQYSTSQFPIVIADCSHANSFTNAILESSNGVDHKITQFVKDVRGSGTGTSPTTTGATTAAPAPTGACTALYGQCGPSGFTGPKCCAQGTCKATNEWYSQFGSSNDNI
ncbi:hypothetical protein Micbo1qcDRAFT_181977 [Microdochium bolleyi]|uniref:CBM1 domain-containing protein n=1 Tax=Microdochium bolleyi TaxID=196109 RepID=A0A136JCW9_9PEZI|nr:hypothetical protein Micbo1qcDRAFT_181977 [Microdochium bolleyi]